MKPHIVFIDVDDTLVRSIGSKRIPMSGVVADVRRLKESGAVLYLRSSGGQEYARASAEELGITDCFTAFLPKPHVIVDDQPMNLWQTTRHVYPAQAIDAQPGGQAHRHVEVSATR